MLKKAVELQQIRWGREGEEGNALPEREDWASGESLTLNSN